MSINGVITALVHSVWQGAVIALVAWALMRFIPGMNAATRYAGWCVALILVIAPPVASLLPLMPSPAAAIEQPSPLVYAFPATEAAPASVPLAATFEPQPEPVEMAATPIWPIVVLVVWLFISVLLLARVGLAVWALGKLKGASVAASPALDRRLRVWMARRGPGRRAAVRLSSQLKAPITAGLGVPAILLPIDLEERLSESEIDQVGLHELAHVRRWDDWTFLAQRIVEAIFFFHPIVLWIGRRLSLEREIACDDWVLAANEERTSYAECLTKLIELSSGRGPSVAPGMALGKRQISRRIEMLLDGKRNISPRLRKGAIVLFTAVACAVSIPAALVAPRIEPFDQQRAVTGWDVAKQAFERSREAAFERRHAIESILLAERDLDLVHQDAQRQAALEERRYAQKLPAPAIAGEPEGQENQEEQQRRQEEARQRKEENERRRREDAEHRREEQDLERQRRNDERQDWGEHRSVQSSGIWSSIEISTRGRIEFSDDDRDVRSISPGGRVRISERNGLTWRTIEITPEPNGGLRRAYFVSGAERPLDGDARAWMSAKLLQVIRDNPDTAPYRVRRIFKQRGQDGVLEEIHHIRSDRSKRAYFEELLSVAPASAELTRGVLRQAAREVSSDGEKTRLFLTIADSHITEAPLYGTYATSAASISSDHEKRRALTALLKQKLDSGAVAEICRAALTISSDGEKSALLIDIVELQSIQDGTRLAYFKTLDSISSDGEKRRVLSAVAGRPGVTKDILLEATRSAAGISSDGEKARVLIELAATAPADPALHTALVRAAGTIGSDSERRRVLSALISQPKTTAELLSLVAKSAAGISSDGEKARVLVELAQNHPLTDAVRPAFFAAVGTISSDGERRRVLTAALMNKDTLNRDGLVQVLRAARGMSSDGEKSRVLTDVAASQPKDEEVLAAYRATLETISSKGEYDRARAALR